MKRFVLALGLLLAVSAFAGAAGARAAWALDIPPHGGQWVVDTARLLPAAEKNALAESLRAYAGQTGTQIVVLTIPGLRGEDLTAYANRVAREWGVGQKDANNGVLILVSAAERKVRFEVGRGIEDRLPDILSKRIQLEITVPLFKAGRYGEGLVASVAAIQKALGAPAPGEPAGAPQAQPRPAPGGGLPLLTLGLIVLAVLLGLAFYRRNASRHGGGPFSRGDGDHSFLIGLLLGLLSSIFRGRGGGGFGGGGGGDGGFTGGGGDFGGGGSSSGWGDDN